MLPHSTVPDNSHLIAQACACFNRSQLLQNESGLVIACSMYAGAVALALGALCTHQLILVCSGRTMYEARRCKRSVDADHRPVENAIATDVGVGSASSNEAPSMNAPSSNHASLRISSATGNWWRNMKTFCNQTSPIMLHGSMAFFEAETKAQ